MKTFSAGYGLRSIKFLLTMLAMLVFVMSSAQAEDRWVTDEFEIMMRSGKGSNQRILRQLKSGTQLEVLQTDEESGYTKVRVSSGAEGWVLTRYLRVTPTSKLTLPTVEKKLTRTSAKNAELNKDIAALKKERQSLQGEVAELQENNSLLQGQVDRITKLSANTIQVDDQNKQLKQRLSDSEKQIDELESNNAQLGSRANREWFLVGGAVLVLGLLLGLILPRMNWRKKSTW
ncbi:MAG: TIGR04211 family SH3 domain-containing protein [Gammaproteobacteria bacterium]|nr:TIGR04211 family SH3 domain-containing protein [Gammaproteobacteria bacterium]MCP4831633.1 TIGR04211 family SH3 domain-containing protein [Gammaproteobacteria bacterium]